MEDVANFLGQLHAKHGLAHATLLGYRSAISRTLKPVRGPKALDLSAHSVVTDLLDGVKYSHA